MLDLRRLHNVEILDHGTVHDRGVFVVHAIANPETIRSLERARYQVDVYEDLDAVGEQRQAEVGKGNRFLTK
jgi:hypothetical protein